MTSHRHHHDGACFEIENDDAQPPHIIGTRQICGQVDDLCDRPTGAAPTGHNRTPSLAEQHHETAMQQERRWTR